MGAIEEFRGLAEANQMSVEDFANYVEREFTDRAVNLRMLWRELDDGDNRSLTRLAHDLAKEHTISWMNKEWDLLQKYRAEVKEVSKNEGVSMTLMEGWL